MSLKMSPGHDSICNKTYTQADAYTAVCSCFESSATRPEAAQKSQVMFGPDCLYQTIIRSFNPGIHHASKLLLL